MHITDLEMNGIALEYTLMAFSLRPRRVIHDSPLDDLADSVDNVDLYTHMYIQIGLLSYHDNDTSKSL